MRTAGPWLVGVVLLLLLSNASSSGHAAPPSPSAPSWGLTPEGLPAYVGAAPAAVGLEHRLETVSLRTDPGAGSFENLSWLAFDSAEGAFYVAVAPASVALVPVNNTTGYLGTVLSIPVGQDPFGVAIDNRSGDVFVTNNGSANVSILSGTNHTVLDNVPVGSHPRGIAYDWIDDEVFVANCGSNNVTVLSGSSLSTVGTVAVGKGPTGVAFDPATDEVFVADSLSGEVSVLTGSSPHVRATVPVGTGPFGVAVDPVAGTVYVTNQGSSTVSVLAQGADSVVANVAVVYPGGVLSPALQGIAFDARDGYLWAGAGSAFAVVIDPATESVVDFVNTDPSGVAYDSNNGAVCVTNTANVTFSCFLFPIAATPAQSVTFHETGLPSGTPWNATLGAPGVTLATGGPDAVFGVQGPTVLGYSVWPASGFAVGPASGVVNVTRVNATVNVTYTRSPGPFEVTFSESGLPSGLSWSVAIAGSSSSSSSGTITTSLASGTYPYTVTPPNGWFESGAPPTGWIAVNGAAVSAPTFDFYAFTYAVRFTASGLSSGTAWSVTLGADTEGSNGTSVTFAEPNGTYAFVLGPVASYLPPSAGSITVNGANVSIPVVFARTYPVTFGESGLPPGTNWSVTLGGTVEYGAVSELSFDEPNATYFFAIGGAGGFSPSPPTGTVVVAGVPVSQGVTFSPVPSDEFPVTFVETGLASGIGWSVTVSNQTLAIHETLGAVAPSSIQFTLPNGSYSWGVFVPAGYSAGIPSGPLVVNGSATGPTSLAFVPAGASTGGAGPVALPWSDVAVVVVVVAAAVALVAMLLRRKSPPKP